MSSINRDSYADLNVYYGDLHNHCNISYGHGSLEAAFRNARLQLDFASVTVHGAWPDLPSNDPQLAYLIDYHHRGFEQAQRQWPEYLAQTERENCDGEFVTFPSFEWHSCKYGDHCIYFKNAGDHRILADEDLETLRRTLRTFDTPALVLPHHIGYRQGYRGINWDAFSPEMSPVAEIFSFHGLAESSEGSYPYLHSMGPRHQLSTAQHGWARGLVFGLVGSTDHHNAFPGSYGYGRLGIWAPALTRDALWQAIQQRRTYVLTGDRIELAFGINDQIMGDLGPAAQERWIDVGVRGGGSIDYVEVLHNNQIIHRESVFPQRQQAGTFKVHVELGWGERDEPTVWDVDLAVRQGTLRTVEPRFRGYGPTASPGETANFSPSHLTRPAPDRVQFQTQTMQNLSLHTPATEGICVEIEGDSETTLIARFNGQQQEIRLAELIDGSRTFYLGGFVSPAICFHRAIPLQEFAMNMAFMHDGGLRERDWYYVRVRQRNDQWAWSSPIWIGEPAST
ncbi:MAG: Tat pathway signal sequence [Chloroflexi bacterium]|nr:Tat pathway signal sequence [Chloroflexota bacterium]